MGILSVMVVLVCAADFEVSKRFSEVEIEKTFQPYLTANILLMEVAGAKVIRLPDGRKVLLAVASTAVKDSSPQERLRAEKVCKTKAFANFVGEINGVQVLSMKQLKEKTTLIVDETGESGKQISELLEITKAKTEGIIKDMPVVGRWKSKDGEIFYLAIGKIVE